MSPRHPFRLSPPNKDRLHRFLRHPRWAALIHTPAVSLLAGTIRACLRHRITGLAGEAAFFALLSLPPLLLSVVATLGYLADLLGAGLVDRVQQTLLNAAATVLTPRSVTEVVAPTLRDVLGTGQAGVISVGFLLALWSGSRALSVYIGVITVLYGLESHRGAVRQRLLSIALYACGLLLGVALLPLIVIGPSFLVHLLPSFAALIYGLYWPTVLVLATGFLSTLYSLSVPVRTPWWENLPGAVLALLIWILGSVALRVYLTLTVQRSSLYGALASPVAVLLWLYVTALAVLIGATVNAELDRLRPQRATARARASAETGQHPRDG